MKKISQILSSVFSPILVPTYGITLAYFLTILSLLPVSVYFVTLTVTVMLTCVIPAAAIYAMYRMGMVSDPGLNNRTERTASYILVILCYLGCAFVLWRAGAPTWLNMFFVGGAIAGVVSTVVNFWWKISAHAAAMGGLVGLLFSIAHTHYAVVSLNWWISGAILATGAVMTARVYLGRHTLLQVLCGAANGFLSVYLLTMAY